MNTRRVSLATVALALAVLVSPLAEAQSTLIDLEVGYQWVSVTGNRDMYRTLINQDDGVVLRDFTLNFTDPDGASFADSIRIGASGFGANPAGSLRFDMGKGTSYRLRLSYHQFENYSALPAFANPLLDDGVIPGQHLWNRDREVIDAELQLLPNRTVTPVIGYRWNRYSGPRQTTYFVGQDEFRLDSDLEETEQEIYGGILFATNRWSGSLLQGWRSFEATDRVGLVPGAGAGNNLQAVLGTDVTLADLTRSVETEADTPVTTANIRGRLGEAVRLTASYVQADADSDTSASELLSGSLVSFRLSRFFSGLDQSIASRTESPSWRGEARVEIDLSQEVRLDFGYEARERELEGWALISSLYLDTLNFSGADPRDISTLIETTNGYEREDEIASARINLRGVGPFVLWAEGAIRSSDLDLSEDVAQIVTPGSQEGEFNREVDVIGAGAAVVFKGARMSLDLVSENADDIVVRTDYIDRLRMRGRVDWALASWLRLLATGEKITSNNGSAGVGYDAETDHVALDLEITPTDTFLLRLAYDNYDTDSSVLVRLPQDFSTERSTHAETGQLLEGGLRWRIAPFDLDLGYSEFENTGSFGFDMTRSFARLGIDFNDRVGGAFEFENNEYTEDLQQLADFDADRFGVFIRWRL